MTLTAGARLGPYEILAPLGAGIVLLPLPAGEGWGEGRSHRGFCENASFSADAPLTPPTPPDGGRGVVTV
jgi:hypothetical protein